MIDNFITFLVTYPAPVAIGLTLIVLLCFGAFKGRRT
jgi:hypothetical protein